MKNIFHTLLILFLISVSFAAVSDTRVALLISGYGNEGDGSISYDLEELAQTYLVLVNNGISLDIVSPKGGAVPVHKKKDDLEYIQQFKQQTPALSQLADTLSAKQALSQEYDGLMVIGGDGAMFDLPFDKNTQALLTQFVHQNKPIAAVCHGPAALLNIKQTSGEYFIKGKRVNSFTLKEEHAFSAELLDKFPFMLQTELVTRGAIFQSNAPMLPFVAEDGLLITAQNPMSVAKAADALVVKLGLTPKARTLYRDEATFQLISRARTEGAFIIDIALASAKESYNLNYMALYGFYAYQLADMPEQKLVELEIMARIGKQFSHPKYSMALINAYLDQGFIEQAKSEKKLLMKQFPETELPKELAQL
ncbi:type 1 glutamine amidotransferase domain-containing protein [Neiella marina]|uniref:Type 1 glutamine amidotransferase domain-containing protein n=1 Tax=Neiella holothuriorum TaxID=2870530 RepID=A0ABS7EE86_9GAMM|nr:type 1 glutamine amidotransferase domain-containing protein [Neiella holothuriorum]MBW8190633.1 type 1 glutamine amidotransferase domain-containing protein [Neiella holothuriorum]